MWDCQNPVLRRMAQCFEKSPVFHILWSSRPARVFLGPRGSSGPASQGAQVLAHLGWSPHPCWASSPLLAQLVAWRRQSTSEPASAPLSSSQKIQRISPNAFFLSRVAKEIGALLYSLLIEIKWIFLGRVAWALIIMHNNDPCDTSSFHLDGCQGCSLTCSSSEERKGPNYPQPPVSRIMTGTGFSRAGGKQLTLHREDHEQLEAASSGRLLQSQTPGATRAVIAICKTTQHEGKRQKGIHSHTGGLVARGSKITGDYFFFCRAFS